MEYTIAELRKLYRSSPAKVFKKLKAGDRLYANDDELAETLRILSVCKIAYELKTNKTAGKTAHEIIIH